jgi:hypothetical protein
MDEEQAIHVYLASSYTVGNTEDNVLRQIEATTYLQDRGLMVFWPVSSHYLHEQHPREYEHWMAIDFAWIRRLDGVIRLTDTPSPGADREVALARELGKPVWEGPQGCLADAVEFMRRVYVSK